MLARWGFIVHRQSLFLTASSIWGTIFFVAEIVSFL